MQRSSHPLISEDRIQQRIQELARDIRRVAGDDEIVLLAVLKGAVLFAADLLRSMEDPVRIEFVRVRSYEGTESVRPPQVEFVGETRLANAKVVVLDDILDTGRTTSVVLNAVRTVKPANLWLCTLLDKPSRRLAPVEADFVGFEIGDHFVIGYGLDYDERYRHLPAVYVLEPEG